MADMAEGKRFGQFNVLLGEGGCMRLALSVAAGVGLWLSAGVPAPALAQSAGGPDKSQYTVFNPVPADQMRDFSTDRPPKANSPYTVDAGHFQYETDIVNFADQLNGATRGYTLLAPNPTFKEGITNNLDLEVNISLVGVYASNLATGQSSTTWGIGDLYTRAKINLWGNDGGQSAFALIPYVKAPTAPAGIGNGAVEGGVIAPLSISLPNDFTFSFNSELDALKDSADDGRHANYVNLVNLSRPIVKDVTLYLELWSDYNADPAQKTTQYSFDTALTWLIRPNLQLDFGADFGLNSATPTVQLFAGLSQRF
ncbi:MAG TPA: transporter [Xanthobacteraceae bacterium]|nr:transporter [Xanthobacteraceae bacterium]